MEKSKSIMTDICKEYLKIAEGEKFDFYRVFTSVPPALYIKLSGKKSSNEIEVYYAVKSLKVKEAIAIQYYGDYRTGFYRPNSTQAYNSDEVLHDLKASQVFRDILWDRHKLNVKDLEKLLELESEEVHKKEQLHRQRRETEHAFEDYKNRHSKRPKFNMDARIKELKVLMHKSHPDKGGDLSIFIECSKELAKIRN